MTKKELVALGANSTAIVDETNSLVGIEVNGKTYNYEDVYARQELVKKEDEITYGLSEEDEIETINGMGVVDTVARQQLDDIANEKIDDITLSNNVLTLLANSNTIKTITLPSNETGTNAKEIELQKSTDYIQWRYVGDTDWTNLIALSDLKGEKGDPGSDANVTSANVINALGYTPVAKNKITLGIHTDGLIYLFVDGNPVGSGIEHGQSGDVIGFVDVNNNIILNGTLAEGTYNVKYEMDDGSTIDIGTLSTIVQKYTNLFDSTSDDCVYGRIGSDGTVRTDAPNNVVTNFIPVTVGDIVRVSGCDIAGAVSETQTYNLAGYDSSKTKVFVQQLSENETYYTLDSKTNTDAQLTVTNNSLAYLRFTCSNSSSTYDHVDVNNIIITVNEEII